METGKHKTSLQTVKCPMGLKLRLWKFAVVFGNKVLDQNYGLTN